MVIGEAPIRTVVAVLHGRMGDALDAWRAVGEFVSRPWLSVQQRGGRQDR